jgi:hypothetical protein
MAVTQISRIQLRRGRAKEMPMPQLASGEMAWAIDTQELYVGNGAVGEGAPYVGNTRILTEHTTILDLVEQYQYKYDTALVPPQSIVIGTVSRSIQSRLDDGTVNAKNFNIVSNNQLLDQTTLIQTAINEISTKVKVTLEFDPGEYLITDTINVPSNVRITGFGKDITVFNYQGVSNSTIFSTVELSTNIVLTNFTIKVTDSSLSINNINWLTLNNTKNSEFENIKLIYNDGITAHDIPNNRCGVNIVETLVGPDMFKSNKFKHVEFHGLTFAAYSNSNASFNVFDQCLFRYLYQGIVLQGATHNGALYNVVTNSIFDTITEQGLIVNNGHGNRSRGNTYINVGNAGGGEFFNRYSIIKFVTPGNSSIQDTFDRSAELSIANITYQYHPEIEGSGLRHEAAPTIIVLESTNTEKLAFRLPLNLATGISVNYIFNSTTYNQVRKGTLHITIDSANSKAQLIDDYEYVGILSGEDAIIFTSELAIISDNSTSTTDLRINYINTNNNDVNTFTFTYSILS